MIKILELPYNKEELENYINKKWYSFLWFVDWKMIFKYNDSPKSTELMKDKTLYDLIKTLNIEDFREYGSDEYLKDTMKEFVLYRRQKNDGWLKERWQMEKVFDISGRYRTFLRNWKKKQSDNILISNEI